MTDIIQMSKGGKKFYPQTHVQAVIGLQDSLVGTNLLLNTSDDNDVGHPVKLPNTNIDTSPDTLSRTAEYTQLTAPPSSSSEMYYRFSHPVANNKMYGLEAGQTYTVQGELSISKGSARFRSQKQISNGVWIDYDGGLSDFLVSDSDGFTHVSYTFTIPDDAKSIYISWQVYGFDSTTIFRFRRMKLEKGSTATDYSLNPQDIATDGSVQTAIASALGKVATINVISQAEYDALADKSGVYFIKGDD